MIYEDTSSVFPQGIDSLIFFDDIPIAQKDILKTHINHFDHGRYTEGTDYLQNSGIDHAFCADLFNMFENRLYAVQNRMIEDPKESNITQYHQHDEPTGNLDDETLWIDTLTMTPVSIKPFDVAKLRYSKSGNVVTVEWDTPGDYHDDAGITELDHIEFVYKKNSVPKNETDGAHLTYANGQRGYVQMYNLSSGTYYARLFIVSKLGKVNSNLKNIIKIKV